MPNDMFHNDIIFQEPQIGSRRPRPQHFRRISSSIYRNTPSGWQQQKGDKHRGPLCSSCFLAVLNLGVHYQAGRNSARGPSEARSSTKAHNTRNMVLCSEAGSTLESCSHSFSSIPVAVFLEDSSAPDCRTRPIASAKWLGPGAAAPNT